MNEIGIDSKTGKILVTLDRNYLRPAEVATLCGDSNKAKKKLNWIPKTTFNELIELMVKSDMDDIRMSS